MKLFLLLTMVATGTALNFTELPVETMKKKTSDHCAFVHVWAAWCSICVEELPTLLEFLAKEKRVKPIVIDVSHPVARKEFSTPWLRKLSPKFPVYFKPNGNDEGFMRQVDPTWSGTLPYSALYTKGVKTKQWVGSVSPRELRESFSKICK